MVPPAQRDAYRVAAETAAGARGEEGGHQGMMRRAAAVPMAESRTRLAAGEPPYQVFVLSSLGLAVGAGFALATLLPLNVVLDWGWGTRHTALVQAHGQIQVLGWAGLLIIGMAYRLMPRFSGRPLPSSLAVWVSWAALVVSLLLRLAAQPAGDGWWRDVGLITSGAFGVLSGAAFALAVASTLAHRQSRAGATGYFFLLGSVAFLLQSLLNLALLALSVERGESVLRPLEAAALLHLQLYGFIMMFVLGVASRAVPTFSGLPRPELSARLLALALAAAVVAYAFGALWAAFGGRSAGPYRLEAAAIALLGPLFLGAVWTVGVFRPAANRLRPASQPQIWFVRSAFLWLAIGGGLAAYYGTRAAVDGSPVDYYGIDALRHVVGLGVASVMMVGMAILVLPEFAVRRMQRRTEGVLPLVILVLLNVGAALRVGTAMAAPHWLSADRYWPTAVAGGLAWVAVALFAVLFVRSLVQRPAIVESVVPLQPAE
jgi:hypothetical protein